MTVNHTSPEFLAALINAGMSRGSLRAIAKTIPSMNIFEACAKREITPEEAANILLLKRESDYWFIRMFMRFFP